MIRDKVSSGMHKTRGQSLLNISNEASNTDDEETK